MSNEADTCRRYVVPKLQAAGWDDEPHAIAEQHAFTDGRIMTGGKPFRRPGKRADYLLRSTLALNEQRCFVARIDALKHMESRGPL